MSIFTARAMLTGLVALGALATPALADSQMVVSPQSDDARSIAVRVSDLNLTSPYDQRTLALRVKRAAYEVCDMERGSVLNTTPSALNCFDNARSGALAQLDARGYAASAAVAAAGGSL